MLKNPRVEELLHRLNPSETALRDWLRPLIDDTMLIDIASDGYGVDEEHLQAVKRIHRGEPIPVPLRWYPREFLELERWSEPDDLIWVASRPSRKGVRGHLIRAFCCEILLRAGDSVETQGYILAENDTMVQLLASVRSIGREAEARTLQLLCWRMLRLPGYNRDGASYYHEERPFFALGILLLCASLYEPPQSGDDLALLADWVVEEVDWAISSDMILVATEEWLLGLTNFDQRHEVWRRLSQEILLDVAKGFSESCAAALRDIALRLVPPAPS